MNHLLSDLFKFFASLWCAVLLIIAVAIIIAAGTFIESYHGAEAAQRLIYYTPWFSIVLVLLAINLAASAISRWPWHKQHTGFLLTHLGIILILIGSLITQRFGIEGQVSIQEGDSESRMTLANPILEIFSPDLKEHFVLHYKPSVFPWSGRRKLELKPKSSVQIHVLQDFPKAILGESVKESAEGSPAIQFSLSGSMAQTNDWLFLDNPEKDQLAMGAAVIRFAHDPLSVEKPKKKSGNEFAHLEFTLHSGKMIQVPIKESGEPKSFTLQGTKIRAKLNRILRDAIVDQNKLIDRSKEWRNPAVELILEGDGFNEQHTIFANFPDFPTVHGMAPSASGMRITMKMAGQADKSASKNELRFIYNSDGLPRYQVKKGDSITGGTVEIGKQIETGWMDFKFSVDQFYHHAEVERLFTPVPLASERAGATRVIQIELSDGNESKNLWLRQGQVERIQMDGHDWHFVYGLETQPLGFSIKLNNFLMDTDPGTNRPASFKSQVTLKDVAKGISRDQLIQMNEPLIHRGFKVYQSAYQVTPGEPDISVFTVARDPGIPIKYAGAIIMVLGIILLFYFKQYSTLKTSDPKMRKI